MPRLVTLPAPLASGPFRVQAAREAGVGQGRLRGGDLARPFHGVRRVTSTDDDADPIREACTDMLTLMRPGLCFSHLTAAYLWGAPLPTARSSAIHVSGFGETEGPRRRGVIGHTLSDDRVSIRNRAGFPVTDPATTWIHLACLLEPGDLVAVGDYLVRVPPYTAEAEHRPFATIGELAERARRYRGRGARAAREAATMVREGSDSRPESLLRLSLVEAGLPEPELGEVIVDEHGFVGRVDLAYPRWRVVVEYDGDQHRASIDQYEHDIRRIERLSAAGWFVVRVRQHGLFRDLTGTVARVRGALHRAGWTPR